MNRNITPMDIEFMGGCFDVDLWQGAPIMVPNKLSQLENDVGFITLADIPPIPTKTSELINDSGFITLASVPTKLSAFTNDVGYITINDIPPIPEISEADITNGTSSISGLISGRRAKQAVETFAPVTDVKVNGTSVVNENGIAGVIVPPEVTDLGNIDPSEYEDDRDVFLNTLLQDGAYRFVWADGDDFEYYVVVESMLEYGYVYQRYWYSEEGSKYLYNCSLTVEDGEVVDRYEDNYMTTNEAILLFAPKTHNHYENVSKAKTVWDYCNDDLAFDNGKPYIVYADTLNSKNWLIERYSAMRSPNQRFIRLYDLGDASHFFLRSGLYSAGAITWGSWKEYPSGGGGSSVFIAEYGVTSYQDILTALEDGKSVLCKYEVEMSGQTVMTAYFSNIVDYIAYQQIIFAAVLNDQTLTLTVDSSDTWADVWGTNVTDVQVNGSSILSQGVASLSSVAVSGSFNDLNDKPEQTEEVTVSTSGDVTYSLEANKIYHFTGQISSLTLTLVATSLIPHYHFDFASGTTQATFSISGVTWMGGEALTPNPSTHYEVDILNGRGIYAEFPTAR